MFGDRFRYQFKLKIPIETNFSLPQQIMLCKDDVQRMRKTLNIFQKRNVTIAGKFEKCISSFLNWNQRHNCLVSDIFESRFL